MADLTALTPCAGLLPLTRGALTLREVVPGAITALMPFRGQEAALSEALRAVHGLGFPAANRVTGTGDARCVWSGRNQALLIGPAPDPALGDHAALTDQSDAWAAVQLDGPGAAEVLARLVPLDLRAQVFGPDHAARSLLQHMTVSISRHGAGFQILAFRSMARTLVHELDTAMSSVAARAGT